MASKGRKIFLEDIGIKKGQTVLDFGCGVGHYTIPASKVVGKEGIVYALDKDREALNKLMQTAESEGLRNIVPIYNQSEELKNKLENETIDAVLFYDVLHYLEPEKRKRVYENAYRILKPGAMLSVYPKHYKSDEPSWNLADMKLKDIIEEIESANFYWERKSFRKVMHDDHYDKGHILVFRRK